MSGKFDELKGAPRKAVIDEAKAERTSARKKSQLPLPSAEEEKRLESEARDRIANDSERVAQLVKAAASRNSR